MTATPQRRRPVGALRPARFSRAQRIALPIATIAALLTGWQLTVVVFGIPKWILPSPLVVVQELVAITPDLLDDIASTATLAVAGFVVGILVGIIVAVALHAVPWLEVAVGPLLVVSQNLPVLAIAPILTIWFGISDTPKIIVITLWLFFPVAVSALAGFRSADRGAYDYLALAGASRRSIFLRLEFPSALPQLFSGLRIAASYAVMGAVTGEWLGSSRGLGHYLVLQQGALRVDRMFAALVYVVALALAFYFVIVWLERRVVRWRTR